MNAFDQKLADDKMRAEIANLIAQTARLNADSAKISRERFMIHVTVMTALLVAVATLIARFI